MIRPSFVILAAGVGLWVAAFLFPAIGAAAEPLHQQIDQLVIGAAAGGQPGELAVDAQFARRVYLDLAGRIPTAGEVREFCSANAANKRAELIDRLLASEDYPRRMQEMFHVMLMERRGENDEWARFLRTSFEQNVPWHQMARAILRPDADDPENRGAAYFITSRLISEGAMAPVDVPGLTRDVGRLMAGLDLQCAQCHDHISVDSYKQQDFQGLHMIFENVKARRDVQFPAVSENVMTAQKDFMSVFIQEPKQTAPVIPGAGEIAIVTFPKDEEYAAPPDRKTKFPGVPKFSPLSELSTRLATANNQVFTNNIVNRLWFAMLGRGLVEPLDLQHADNPATHPELLSALSAHFADGSHEFNIKWLLREMALSQAYQRTSRIPAQGPAPEPTQYLLANEKRLSGEQLFWSTLIATGTIDQLRATAEQVASESAAEQKQPQQASKAPALPQSELERLMAGSTELTKLKDRFVKTFANPPQEPEIDFEPTVEAALYLMHDEQVLAMLKPQPGNLIDRLTKIDDPAAIADELFYNILSRAPSEEDRADVEAYLSEHSDDRAQALGQIAWALLSCTEFCVNH